MGVQLGLDGGVLGAHHALSERIAKGFGACGAGGRRGVLRGLDGGVLGGLIC